MTSLGGSLIHPFWVGPPFTADVLIYLYLVCDYALPSVSECFLCSYSNQYVLSNDMCYPIKGVGIRDPEGSNEINYYYYYYPYGSEKLY